MAKLNLDNNNVLEEELTVAEIRADTDELREKVFEWLDEAQGKIFGDDTGQVVYLVIKVAN